MTRLYSLNDADLRKGSLVSAFVGCRDFWRRNGIFILNLWGESFRLAFSRANGCEDRLAVENTSAATRQFYELVWPHRATILRVAQILVGETADAEDLAQETLLKALRSLATLREGSDVRAWLLTILRHARVDQLRVAGRSAGTLSLDQLEIEPAEPGDTDSTEGTWKEPSEILEAFSDRQVIEALQRLPEEIRLTLLLADVEQLDHRDAANILQVPVGTVKSRVHRGRAMLRNMLSPVAREMGLLRQ